MRLWAKNQADKRIFFIVPFLSDNQVCDQLDKQDQENHGNRINSRICNARCGTVCHRVENL